MRTGIKYSVIIYNILIGFVFLGLIWAFDLKEEYGLMLLYSINSAVVFMLLFREEVANYKGLSPNLLLLVGYTLRLVYPSIEMSIGALQGEKITFLFTYNDVTDHIFPTLVWMNIYYMILYYAFNKFAKGIALDGYIKPYLDRYHLSIIAVLLFIPGVAYDIVASFIPDYFIPSLVKTIFGSLSKLALLIQVFNAALNYTKRKYRLLVIMVIVESLRATFFGFYKAPIMMPFVFYMLFVFLHSKNQGKPILNPRILFLGACFFVVISFFVYPFMQIKRYESGFSNAVGETGIATRQYSNIQIAKDVLTGKRVDETENLSTSGRFNAIPANAFFYKECSTKGLKSYALLRSNAELLVPKFLNPNKHGAVAGLMAFSYAESGSFSNYETVVSSNFVGQFASAYLIGGWFVAIVLAFFNGFFLIKYYNFLVNNIRNLFALILIVGQLFATLEGFEEIHDGGILRTGLALVYMLIINLTNLIFKRRKIKHASLEQLSPKRRRIIVS